MKLISLAFHFFLGIANNVGIRLEQANMRADDFLRHAHQIRICQVIKEAWKGMRQIIDAKIIGIDFAVGIRYDAVEIFPGFAIDALNFKDVLKQRLIASDINI